jgi:hypothetical protein
VIESLPRRSTSTEDPVSNSFFKYSFAALFVLVGLGAADSTVRASSPSPVEELEAEPACSSPDGDTAAISRATTSAMPNPYYCICCEATGSGSCCSKC